MHECSYNRLKEEYTATLKMTARNFLPRYIAFSNREPIDSLTISNSSAIHLVKQFVDAISLIVSITASIWCIFGIVNYSHKNSFNKNLCKHLSALIIE